MPNAPGVQWMFGSRVPYYYDPHARHADHGPPETVHEIVDQCVGCCAPLPKHSVEPLIDVFRIDGNCFEQLFQVGQVLRRWHLASTDVQERNDCGENLLLPAP